MVHQDAEADCVGSDEVCKMMISERLEDDIHYVCSLLEYIARETDNYVSDIAALMPVSELAWQLKYAHVNHCMTFEQVAERVIGRLGIKRGKLKYSPNRPSCVEIGEIYKILTIYYITSQNIGAEQAIKKAVDSVLSDFIADHSF